MKEDAPEPGRLSLATAMAFALAVAAARGETAVAGLLAGILALAEDGRLDEIDSRVAWAPQFLWGEQSDNSERRPVVHLETAGVDGLPAALVASQVLARGRGRLGIGTGPMTWTTRRSDGTGCSGIDRSPMPIWLSWHAASKAAW